jgi:hypothetical protein
MKQRMFSIYNERDVIFLTHILVILSCLFLTLPFLAFCHSLLQERNTCPDVRD